MQTQNSRKDNQLSRDQLIEEYLPHVKRIVHRIAIHLPPHVEIDDLIHVGVIGLMQAIERYDSTRNNTFLTYAVFRIKGAVLSELRSRDFLSRANRRKVRELDRAYMGLEQKRGRTVDDRELADEIGVPLEEVQEIKKMSSISFVSFEEMGIQTEEEKRSVVDALMNNGSDDALTLTRVKEVRTAVAEAIEQLPEKEKLVISLYYVDELTMKETGKVLHITESRVSQIHSQAVVHLRSSLRKQGLL
ncbi:MAG: FliA/WhiG family RNA polymerase sigma factor [Desulfobacterales bacterium]|nr:FliA/WhiG family RNA polymerase sigma factor [Desulfobacterales bacterium]